MHRLLPKPQRETPSLRWDQLRECVVGVFDFTAYRTPASLEEAAPVAAVAYELGIAMALGRPVILIAKEEQNLPFDLDIEPLKLRSGSDQAADMADALDQAVYTLQRGTAGCSIEKSVRHFRSRFGGHSDFNVRLSMEPLSEEVVKDPVKTRLLMASPLTFLGTGGPFVLDSTWPGDYPDPDNPRCFHVSAFGPAWAATTMRILEESCPPGLEYIRGDISQGQDILRSIWDEICRATHVVTDLTGLNTNVALELGLVHTLGRKVLLISQDPQPERYFRAVAKHRIHRYALETEDDADAFKKTIGKFLTK
jgi:nucleoside 2-deoxyribosyltransferase